ncbi:costars family protein ABRACL isoform X2 [Mustela lutreola]|uniref:costars family protein ABRACL isoform X2 n=1 Tax=Mustela lutreola TaxID=9666 RepID=UPI0027978C35|nr:costars family protein ABRACL isoform X2 [Mustela lutreola]
MGPGGAEARGDCYWNWAETLRWGPGGRALTPPRLPPTSASAHVTLCRPGATGKPAAWRRFPLRCGSAALPLQAAMNVDHEINLLVEEIHRLGSKNCILHQYGGCIGDKNAEREAGEEVLQLSA